MKQLKDNTSEALTLIQGFISLYAPEAFGATSVAAKISAPIAAGFLFIIATALKNPFSSKFKRIMLVLITEAALIAFTAYNVSFELLKNKPLMDQIIMAIITGITVWALISLISNIWKLEAEEPTFNYVKKVIRS